MRRFCLFTLLALIGVGVGGFGQGNTLVVYTYDSFVSFGPGIEIESRFEAQTGIDVQFVATADSRAMLARMLSERSNGGTSADVFIGVEVNDLSTATSENAFLPLSEAGIPNLRAISTHPMLLPSGSIWRLFSSSMRLRRGHWRGWPIGLFAQGALGWSSSI